MDSEAPTNLQHKIPLTEQPTPVNSLVFAGRGAKLKTFIFDINIQNQANQLLELRPLRGWACETRSVFCQIASWDSASSLCHLKVFAGNWVKIRPPKTCPYCNSIQRRPRFNHKLKIVNLVVHLLPSSGKCAPRIEREQNTQLCRLSTKACWGDFTRNKAR